MQCACANCKLRAHIQIHQFSLTCFTEWQPNRAWWDKNEYWNWIEKPCQHHLASVQLLQLTSINSVMPFSCSPAQIHTLPSLIVRLFIINRWLATLHSLYIYRFISSISYECGVRFTPCDVLDLLLFATKRNWYCNIDYIDKKKKTRLNTDHFIISVKLTVNHIQKWFYFTQKWMHH